MTTAPITSGPARSDVSRFMTSSLDRSEVHLEVDVDDVAVRADRHGIGGVAGRALGDVNELGVQAQPALLHEVEVLADAELGRFAVVAEHLRAGRVQLQEVLDRHPRPLELVAGVDEIRDAADVGSGVLAEPARVELALER